MDERGFIISKASTKYIWNADGQLTHALLKNSADGETMISYNYDHRDRLMSRVVSTANGGKRQNRTQFVYDETRPELVSYCVIDSRIIGFVYDSNNHLIALSIEGTKYYVASDHLGSPVAVYTVDGVLVKEIVRNVWGVTIKDSNPSFWLPVDFRGSIRDPLTGLNHFEHGRAYDASIGQWLTPDWQQFDQSIMDMVHMYRFHGNDPINDDQAVVSFDGDLGTLPMASIDSWLQALGYRLDYIFGSKHQEANLVKIEQQAPLETSLSLEATSLYSQFTRLSIIPESKIKISLEQNGLRNGQGFMQIHEISIATLPSTLNAVLISRSPLGTTVHSVETDKNPTINSVLISVLNGTYSLPFHLVHHEKDEFYFVQPTNDVHGRMQKDIDQLHKLGSLVNVTRINTDLAEGGTSSPSSSSHLLVSSGNLFLNIRYAVSLDDELSRVARIARRKALNEAWQREVYYLRHGFPGMAKLDWTSEERKSLLHNGGMVRDFSGSDIHGIERYTGLADDPTNVRFKRDAQSSSGSLLLNRKRRNHSHRGLRERSG